MTRCQCTIDIERARKHGGGEEAGGAEYHTIMYEGYGPGGVAVLVECLTDNRNRAASEVRTAMTRNGGSMADPGSVSYLLFNRKGVVLLPKNGLAEDDVPSSSIPLDADTARKVFRLIEALEDCDDVQNVYANFDVSDDVLAEAQA